MPDYLGQRNIDPLVFDLYRCLMDRAISALYAKRPELLGTLLRLNEEIQQSHNARIALPHADLQFLNEIYVRDGDLRSALRLHRRAYHVDSFESLIPVLEQLDLRRDILEGLVPFMDIKRASVSKNLSGDAFDGTYGPLLRALPYSLAISSSPTRRTEDIRVYFRDENMRDEMLVWFKLKFD